MPTVAGPEAATYSAFPAIAGMPKTFQSLGLCFAAAIALGACDRAGTGDTPVPPPPTEQVPAPADGAASEGAAWQLQAGDTAYEGALFRYFLLDGNLMIHLINRDAVNFAFSFEGEPSGQRTATYASLAVGRGPVCERAGPAESFNIQFEPAGAGWISGTFAGMLACPDYELLSVKGRFQIEAPE
jgi:hypothetical protein